MCAVNYKIWVMDVKKNKMISSTYSFLYTKYDDTLYFIADKDISMKYIRNILKTNAIL